MAEDSTPPKLPTLGRGPGSLFIGATYPLRALGLFIAAPRLRRYVLLPILLNLVIGVTLYAGLLFAGLQAIDAFLSALATWIAHSPQPHMEWTAWTATLPHWNFALPNWVPHFPNFQLPSFNFPQITLPNWITELPEFGFGLFIGLLRLLLVITLLLVTGFILLQFGVLLGAPWYGKLSEELEKMQTGQLHTIHINPVQEISRAVLYEVKKLVIAIAIGIPLLFCNFFPGIGTAIATAGGITLAATIVCLDFLDAALERRRLRFRQKLGVIWRSLPASASFALVCLGLVSIPFLNLLAIPVCVAAGTLFFCDRVYPWLPVGQPNRK